MELFALQVMLFLSMGPHITAKQSNSAINPAMNSTNQAQQGQSLSFHLKCSCEFVCR